jgi:hypothetical protein
MIAAIEADKAGKPIQRRCRSSYDPWSDYLGPRFNFDVWDYRVKPDSVGPEEIWVNVYSKSIMAAHESLEIAKQRRGNNKCLGTEKYVRADLVDKLAKGE